MRGALCVALAAALGACRGGRPESSRPPAAAATVAEARAALLAELGEPRCTATAECRVAGVGMKPCGGPEQYVAYSVAAVDTFRLAAALARYAEAATRRNAEQGLVSDCRFLSQPPVRCDGGRCTTQ